jgi:hypothetical protein
MKFTRMLIASTVVLSAAWLAIGRVPSTDAPGSQAVVQAADSESAASATPLVVHEWGTFTSFSGSNGVKLEFRPLIENDLPPFVYNRFRHSTPDFGKYWLPAIQRMETPVTYFYTPVERDVTVRVDFPQGLLTEFYPPVRTFAPKSESKDWAEMHRESHLQTAPPLKNSMLDWGTVHLIPAEALRAHVQDAKLARRIGQHVEATMVPAADSHQHYATARQTDSAIVQVRHQHEPGPTTSYVAPGDYFEKFLFYRGLGNFDLPLTLTAKDDGNYSLANAGGEEIRSLFLVSVQGETIQFRRFARIGPESTLELAPAASTATINDLAQAVVSSLVAEGLYVKEAEAMVNTWRTSWFGEEGTRLFYIVPQSFTDELLPLKINPLPTELVRVLVGRMEIMTPTREQQVLDMVQRSAAARKSQTAEDAPSSLLPGLLAMGRLAEPALVRVRQVAKDDGTQQEAERLVVELRAAYERLR